MRTTATLATVSLLALAGCGSADAEPEPTPSTQTSPTESLPQLEAGQTDEQLAEDVLNALNIWFHTGEDEVEQRWSPEDGQAALSATTLAVAEKYRNKFVSALLIDDFDEGLATSGRHFTTQTFVDQHADVLYRSTDGHTSTDGEPVDGYDLTFELNGIVEATTNDTGRTFTLSVSTVAEPATAEFPEPQGASKMTVSLVSDGDVMKIASMS